MNEKIEIEVQYSIDDYIRGVEFSHQEKSSSTLNFLILLVSTSIGFFVFYWFVIRKSGDWLSFDNAPTLIFGLMLVIPLVYFLRDFKPFTGNYITKQYESSSVLKEKQKISFDEEGIESKSDSHSSKINWNAIIKTAETTEDIYFFVSNKSALFIPKRVFTDAQLIQIRELAKSKLGDKANF